MTLSDYQGVIYLNCYASLTHQMTSIKERFWAIHKRMPRERYPKVSTKLLYILSLAT